MKAPASQFLRFCLVGGVGFVVDAGLTLLLVRGLGLSPTMARVLAFLVAASVTWALNARLTFRSDRGYASWLPYVLSTSVGALINGTVYLLWLRLSDASALNLLIGVALGSAVALLFNFTIARELIFRPSAPPR